MTSPQKPTFLIKSEINEIYKTPKGKDSIKPYLLPSADFDTIQQAKKVMGGTANDIYELLLNNWNDYVDRENKQLREKFIKEQVAYELKQTKIQTKIKR